MSPKLCPTGPNKVCLIQGLMGGVTTYILQSLLRHQAIVNGVINCAQVNRSLFSDAVCNKEVTGLAWLLIPPRAKNGYIASYENITLVWISISRIKIYDPPVWAIMIIRGNNCHNADVFLSNQKTQNQRDTWPIYEVKSKNLLQKFFLSNSDFLGLLNIF